MKDEYVTGVEKMLRDHLIVTGVEKMLIDYLIDDKISKEEIKKILSLTPEEYTDYVINYGLKD